MRCRRRGLGAAKAGGAGGEAPEDVASHLGLEVERERPLVRALTLKHGPHALPVERFDEAFRAHHVRIAERLDFYHLRTEHRELIGAEGPGEHVREVQHPIALERLHGRLPSRRGR